MIMTYTISTDPDRLPVGIIHDYLSNHSYWAKGIPFETVERSVRHSLNFGVYTDNELIGYARVITDYATIAYLGDVFILPEHRGKGLSRKLMEEIAAHPTLQGLRRWILLTKDAHDLYKKSGWKAIANPPAWMEKHFPDIYQSSDNR